MIKVNVCEDDMLVYRDWLYDPNDTKMKKIILTEAYCTIYIVYFGSTKMFKGLQYFCALT